MKKIIYSIPLLALALLASCENDGNSGKNGNVQTDTTGQTPKDNSALYTGSVTDCEDNTYPLVTIGNQTWMAENLRCAKYDTQSELPGQHIYTTQLGSTTPYYTDPYETDTEHSGNLTSYHRAKLGYLYNWPAAMALSATEAESRDLEFEGKRQGICPNGFHLPTQAEWHELLDAVGGERQAAIRLKATTGWFVGDDYHNSGTDDYGFEALPAGYATGPNMGHTGMDARFWTATPYGYTYAYQIYMQYYPEDSMDLLSGKKHAVSVRCVRD